MYEQKIKYDSTHTKQRLLPKGVTSAHTGQLCFHKPSTSKTNINHQIMKIERPITKSCKHEEYVLLEFPYNCKSV